MSGMPGPLSSNTSRTPTFRPSRSSSICSVPPPPYSTVLRAISLAAVTSFVRSTRPRPRFRLQLRTTCRTLTMSCCSRTTICSLRAVSIGHVEERSMAVGDRGAEQRDSFLHVERRTHALEGEPELDERYRNGGLHADDHRGCIEDTRDA